LGRACVYRACEGLSRQHAAWKPAEHVKSIQELLVHLGGSERFWLGQLGHPTRDFPEGDSLEAALTFLKDMENAVRGIVEPMSAAQFNQAAPTERGEFSMAWALKRVTQHMFYHLGTLVYLRSACEPSWEGDAGLRHWQKAVDAFSALVVTGDQRVEGESF